MTHATDMWLCRFTNPALVWNVDETMVATSESKVHVLTMRDVGRPSTVAEGKLSCHIKAIVAVGADGTHLPHTLTLPRNKVPMGLDLETFDAFCWAGSKSGWINNVIFERWLAEVFVPAVQAKRIKLGVSSTTQAMPKATATDRGVLRPPLHCCATITLRLH